MADENKQFNAHQEDLRGRADSLVRAIFVLVGDALTVSIGFFGDSSRLMLSQDLIPILQTSWWGLFVSILCLASSLVAIIGRDYAFSERWRQKLDGNRQDAPNGPGWCERPGSRRLYLLYPWYGWAGICSVCGGVKRPTFFIVFLRPTALHQMRFTIRSKSTAEQKRWLNKEKL